MNKFILFMTFIALGFLTVLSTISPDASAVWLASADQSFDILRSSVMLVLLILMFTNPPRNPILRSVIGVASVAFIGWSGLMTYENMLLALDGIIFLAAGIASLIAVLEFEPDDAFTKQVVSPNFKKAIKH